MIYISSDHGGFELKNKIVDFLKKRGDEVADLGPNVYDLNDDYPDFVEPLVKKVLENPGNKGILICRNGVGVSMLANKFRGVRAGLSWNAKHAASSRNDDNTNVLALPADYISEEEAFKTVETWLTTPFTTEEKFSRRLAKANL